MSLIDKIEDMKASLTELTTELKVASQSRRNAAMADDTDSLGGMSLAQLRAERDKNLNPHTSRRDNPHDVTAEQIGIPTKAQVDAQKTTWKIRGV